MYFNLSVAQSFGGWLSCKTDAGISRHIRCLLLFLVALSTQPSPYYQRTDNLNVTFSIRPTIAYLSLKMTRLLAASLLVALVAILSTAPIDAAGESVLANDPVRGQETFLERRLKVCGGNALRARLATRIDIDVVGCLLVPGPGGVVSKHTAVLFSRRAPFLDSHQFVSFPFCLENAHQSLSFKSNKSPKMTKTPKSPKSTKSPTVAKTKSPKVRTI